MNKKKIPEMKQEFKERMQELLGDDFVNYKEILKKEPLKSIRCNELKISPEELKKRLESKGWKISQPFNEIPGIMVVDSELQPGELGRALEHLLGYYYIQELSSMLPVIALNPEKDEKVLDLCSAPGSKTSQFAVKMQNTGLILANEVSLGRIKILSSNLERCGVTNTIITKKEGSALCKKLNNLGYKFDKILIDAPCSGEGTLRSSPKTYLMWNPKTIKALSKLQKKLVSDAIKLLKSEGELVYSTCTHAPEENEEVVDFVLKNFKDVEIQKIKLPINPRQGILRWKEKEYLEDVKNSCRIYPHDNNTEGFFIAKFRRIK